MKDFRDYDVTKMSKELKEIRKIRGKIAVLYADIEAYADKYPEDAELSQAVNHIWCALIHAIEFTSHEFADEIAKELEDER